MTAKEYLRQIRIYDARINNLMRHLEDLKDMATATGGFDYSKDRVDSSPPPDPLADRVIRIIEAEEELGQRIDELIELKSTVVDKLDMLKDDRYITILRLRYIEYKDWQQIADSMGYTLRWVYRLHGRALQAFQKLI